jgi:hypothetical protein
MNAMILASSNSVVIESIDLNASEDDAKILCDIFSKNWLDTAPESSSLIVKIGDVRYRVSAPTTLEA